MNRVWRLVCLIMGVALSGLLVACTPEGVGGGEPSAAERELYDLIIEYRSTEGLPSIPLSPSLTRVAQIHAADLTQHYQSGTDCNLHSWSGNGTWSSCCYIDDHSEAQCMWDKPRELTDYTGNGYEIAYAHSPAAEPAAALNAWKTSPGHNNVIINADTWASLTWNAIGVGINGEYVVVWFGEEPDPAAQ